MTARPPFAEAARTLLRDTVLDAVDELVRSQGWAGTRLADVASAAGVSRQTLYNEFGSRPGIVEAYVTREIERLLVQVEEAVRTQADDAHRALRTAFELFLKLASDEPVVQVVASDAEGGELLRMLTGVGQAVAMPRVAALIADVWAQVSPADAALLADTLVRLAISHAVLPQRDPGEVADGVSRMLASFVDQILRPS